MKNYQIVIVCTVIIILLVLIIQYVLYRDPLDDKTPRISFKQFIHMYNICPDKWQCWYDGTVRYDYTHSNLDLGFNNFIDFIKYQVWKRKKEKADNKKYLDKMMLELNKKWQKDITKYQSDYSEEIINRVNSLRLEIKELEERYNDLVGKNS